MACWVTVRHRRWSRACASPRVVCVRKARSQLRRLLCLGMSEARPVFPGSASPWDCQRTLKYRKCDRYARNPLPSASCSFFKALPRIHRVRPGFFPTLRPPPLLQPLLALVVTIVLLACLYYMVNLSRKRAVNFISGGCILTSFIHSSTLPECLLCDRYCARAWGYLMK